VDRSTAVVVVRPGLESADPYARMPFVAFARWDPLRDLLAIQQRLDRFAPGPTGWHPAVDLHETAEAYVLTAELAGLLESDVSVEATEHAVTLSGLRRERPGSCEQYHRLERGHGEFSRRFELPLPIASDRISAVMRDGVLTVTCPKADAVALRRVNVT
jgi:HSP20 family protein